MSSPPANQGQSPVITLEVIYPTALGHWLDPYSENTPTTRFRIDDFDQIFRFINRVRKNQAYADRIRSVGVTFVDDEVFTRTFGLLIATVLPALRNVDALLLEGCIDHDPGIRYSPVLSTPVHFQRLTNLKCDIPPSREFESFLAANPTITDLFCGGSADINCYLGSGRTLPPDILPNLAVVECDVFLMHYYIPHRPVTEVIPRQVTHLDENGMHIEFVSLIFSTAGGGIEVGGGVQTFHLGRNFPLHHLALLAPNLLRFFVSDDNEMASMPPHLFWTTPGWEQNLTLFRSLQEIHVQSASPFTLGEQNTLVTRWSAGHTTLAHITFESNVPATVQQISSPGLVHGRPDDEQVSSLPAHVHGVPDDESDSHSESDHSDDSDGLDGGMSGEQVNTITSRWKRGYDAERWFLVRD